MNTFRTSPSAKAFAEAGKALGATRARMFLRLFVAGNTPRSAVAVQALRQVCEDYLSGGYELEVIDIRQQPTLAREAQIIATPTLVKYAPSPKKVMVGDFSHTERVLVGLGIAA